MNKEKEIIPFGNKGEGYFDRELNKFIITKKPIEKHFNLKEIVDYLNKKGFTTYGDRPIKPEQCTGGKGCEVYYKGLKFYVYINERDVRKIGPNRFRYNDEAYKIINKIIRLINAFGIYTIKGKKNKEIKIIDKEGNVLSKRLPKLSADYIYGGILFENKAEALEYANKLLLNNGVNCSVTNMVAYWNKTIQVD